MKLLFTIMFISLINQIPEIKSNATEEQKSNSLIYDLYNGKDVFLIAYINECYWWSDKKHYQVLVYENNKWEKLLIRSKRSKDGKWSKPRITHKPIKSEVVNALLADLSENAFWKLENDQLNIEKQENDDGTFTKHSLDDGVNYKFEILNRNNFRIIESYEPAYFLKAMPKLKEREVFIKCTSQIEQIFQQ